MNLNGLMGMGFELLPQARYFAIHRLQRLLYLAERPPGGIVLAR